MQRLLYHAPDNPSQESPFDRAIVQVVQGQEASIASPYIGLQYLQRLIRLSRSWRLISDVLEWLSATPPQGSQRGVRVPQGKQGMHDPQAIAQARDLNVEVITRSKRILALVDDYAAIQSSTNAPRSNDAHFGKGSANAPHGSSSDGSGSPGRLGIRRLAQSHPLK